MTEICIRELGDKTMCENKLAFAVGGMWDDSEWYILLDEPTYGECPHTVPCPRDKKLGTINYPRMCPRIVVANNEGGYNSTGVCLDCILAAAPTLGRNG